MTPPGEKPKNISEIRPPLLEVEDRPELEQQLLDVLTLPEELSQKLEEKFDVLVDTMIASQTSPKAQKAIRLESLMFKWGIFGRPDEPLPPELALYKTGRGYLTVDIRPDIYVMSNARELFESGHFRQAIEGPIDEYYKSIKPDIEKVMRSLIESGPTYAFLRSFDIKPPTDLDQPLSPSWRRIRENQIEEEIRHHFGIPRSEHIPPHSEPDRELRKRLYGLDNETMRRTHEDEDDTMAKFRAWLRTQMIDWIDEDEREEVLERIGTPRDFRNGRVEFTDDEDEGYDNVFIIGDKGEVDVYDVGSWSYKLCENERSSGGYNLGLTFGDSLALRMVEHIDDTKNYNQLLNIAVDEAVSDASGSSYELAGYDTYSRGFALAIRLRRPQSPIYEHRPDRNTAEYVSLDSHDYTFVSIHSQEKLQENAKRTEGWVDQKGNKFDGINRLIQRIETDEEIPYRAGLKADLELTLYDDQRWSDSGGSWSGIPFIAGYELVSHFGNNWAFVRSEVDPYTGAGEVKIDPDSTSRLAEEYKQIGLIDLAAEIQKTPDLDVVRLTQLVRNYSDYTFDESLLPDRSGHDYRLLEDFGRFVQNGRLQVQCTGANSFLSKSLSVALPESICSTFHGLVLAGDERISGVWHEQTLLAYQGNQYILDATPSAPFGLDYGSGEGFGSKIGEPRPKRSRLPEQKKEPELGEKTPKPKHEEVKEVPEEEFAKESEESVTEAVRNRVQQILRLAFNAPNDRVLYELVVGLKEGDPVRQSLTAVMRLQPGQTVQVEGVLSYLETYSKADANLIKKAGLPQYDPALISLLTAALQTVAT